MGYHLRRRTVWFQKLPQKIVTTVIAIICLISGALASSRVLTGTRVEGRVLAPSGAPLDGVKVQLTDSEGRQIKNTTHRDGWFRCTLPPGDFRISLQKGGYLPIRDRLFMARVPKTNIQLILQPSPGANQLQKFVNIIAPRSSAIQGQYGSPSHASEEVHQNLPELSETMLDRYGDIRTAGAQSRASRYLVDTQDQPRPQDFSLMNNLSEGTVSSPDTKSESSYRFGSTPIYEAPATVTMTRADSYLQGWKVQLSNALPGIRYQRGFRLGDWAPQLIFSGPLLGRSVSFTDRISGEHALVTVPELPRNADSMIAWAGSNVATLQAGITAHHTLRSSFLASRRLDSHVGLSPFNPLESTVTLGANRFREGLSDEYAIDRNIVETGITLEDLRSSLNPQGGTPYLLYPGLAAGSYFETLQGHSEQAKVFTHALVPLETSVGSEQFQVGVDAVATNFSHHAIRKPFEILDEAGNVVQITSFIGDSRFSLSNTRWSGYAQDYLATLVTSAVGSRFTRRLGSSDHVHRVLATLLRSLSPVFQSQNKDFRLMGRLLSRAQFSSSRTSGGPTSD